MMQIKTVKILDTTYLSTLSMYKGIGLYAHQKLKERIVRMGLEMRDIENFGTAVTLGEGIVILEAYQENSEGERLTQVNVLLEECRLLIDPQLAGGIIDLPEKLPIKGKLISDRNTPKTKPPKESRVSRRKEKLVSKPVLVKEKQNIFLHQLTQLTTLLRTEQFIFLVLIFATGIQINHTAHLYHRASSDLDVGAGWIGAYIFGTVTELTALLLTIHEGKRNKLIIFALLTFWINLLYYDVLEDFINLSCELMRFINKMTLSGIIAFVLYAYTDLFTGWVAKK